MGIIAMPKILVIEDESNIAKNIKQILDLSNFQTIIAKDGKEGLSLVKKENPDLILCDIMMPELDGYQVLTEIRKDDDNGNLPFIFLTAKSNSQDFRKGMNLGADDYLIKPFTSEELLKGITTRLEKQAKINNKNQTLLDKLSFKIQKTLPHELYTPLNGIIVSGTLLHEYADTMKVEEIKEIAKILVESSQRLKTLSEKFLLCTYLELIINNPEKLQTIHEKNYECNTKNILSTIAEKQARKIQRENDLKLELEDININMSESDFVKIVEELVENAFKFSNKGDEVIIRTNINDDNYLNLFIQNQGQGMTLEERENIAAFMQFHKDIYAQNGCGLGLIIVQKIIEIYQGILFIESVPHEQTTIHILLKR